MKTYGYFKGIIDAQKKGSPAGVCSICSAHPIVIEAAMEHYKNKDQMILIEATANQVNQFGGYSGMRPAEFYEYVLNIANKADFPRERIILGGDHLGPLVWSTEPGEEAMLKAENMIEEYIRAGFRKIHLDTSMKLAEDPDRDKLDVETIAERAARLCVKAENVCAAMNENDLPVYVIGSEVPTPGGTKGKEEELAVTRVKDLKKMLKVFANAFKKRGLDSAWERVVAVVIQPGVEFSGEEIMQYDRGETAQLRQYVQKLPNIVLEGHSTDYQTRERLTQMKEDGIAILKVGPALTFALREGLFALEHIEQNFFEESNRAVSLFARTLDNVMMADRRYWANYYRGTEEERRLARKFSLSDRSRYYLRKKEIIDSLECLLRNLQRVRISLGMLSQYMPHQYKKVLDGSLTNDAYALLKDKVKDVLRLYD